MSTTFTNRLTQSSGRTPPTDTFPNFGKLAIYLKLGTNRLDCSLGQKFQCKGPLKRVEETNYFEEVFDRKRALEAILYTDYTDIMVVYSCKENINDPNLPVMGQFLSSNRLN